MKRTLRSLLAREEGSSLAAVLMVGMVLTVIAVGAMQTSQHATNVTSVDRERLQSVQSAEAGVNDAIRRVQAGAGCDSSPTAAQTLSDGSASVGTFQEKIEPEAGTVCGSTVHRVVHAWGFAPTGSGRAMRELEVNVTLVPQAGFPYTLFADGTVGTIYVKNSGSISGDAYAKSLDQSKNNLAATNIVTPGSVVTKNNAAYSGMLWSGGNVTLGNNCNIGGSVIASGTAVGTQGTIALGNNSIIGSDAIAKSTITLSNGAAINGTKSQNNANAPPPPILHKPVFTYNPANYSPAPTDNTAAQITTALNTAKNNLQGTFHSTDAAGVVTIPSGTVTGPLTIISSGKVVLPSSLSVSGGPFQVVVIALSTAADAISATNAFTGAGGLDVLLFSLGGVDQKNNINFKGAIYADQIDAKNTFTITKSASLATNAPVGFTFDASSSSVYVPIQGLWREIVPGTPPS